MFNARIQVTCLGCNEQFLVLASEQGHVVECPNCAGYVDVPDLSSLGATAAQAEERRLAENARQIEENAKQQLRFGQLLDRFEEVIGQLAKVVEQMGHAVQGLNKRKD